MGKYLNNDKNICVWLFLEVIKVNAKENNKNIVKKILLIVV